MVETQRNIAALYTLLQDNNTGEISPQDLRDAVETVRSDHGELFITSSSATSFGGSEQYVPAAGTFSLSSETNHNFVMDVSGQLKYTGLNTRIFHVAASVSVVSGGSNITMRLGIGKNGSVVASSVIHVRVTTGTDVRSSALHSMVSLSNGEYLELMVGNWTDTSTITLETGNLFAMGMPL